MSETGKVIYLSDYRLDKVPEKAVQLVLSGDLLSAINEYLRFLKRRPKDLRARQRLAELYTQVGKQSTAYTHYMMVAEGYTEGGFYLKALAAYKQMQKFMPENPELVHHCAELSMQQGLVGNALSEYRQLMHLYEKQRKTVEVVQVQEIIEEILGKYGSVIDSSISEFSFDDESDSETSLLAEFDFDEPDFDSDPEGGF